MNERNLAASRARRPVQPRKQAKREGAFTITWPDVAKSLVPGVSRTRVVGVCSDCNPDVARLYLAVKP